MCEDMNMRGLGSVGMRMLYAGSGINGDAHAICGDWDPWGCRCMLMNSGHHQSHLLLPVHVRCCLEEKQIVGGEKVPHGCNGQVQPTAQLSRETESK